MAVVTAAGALIGVYTRKPVTNPARHARAGKRPRCIAA
jgi:hypothetical protein